MRRRFACGKAPELWYAETGKTEPVSFKIADGRTTVPLKLEPWGSVFVVFRKATSETSHTVTAVTVNEGGDGFGAVDGELSAGRGAPPSITLDKLASWSENADPGVKYFSGTGTYTKTIDAPAAGSQAGRRCGSTWVR